VEGCGSWRWQGCGFDGAPYRWIFFLSSGLFFKGTGLGFGWRGVFGEPFAVLDRQSGLDEEGFFGPRAYVCPFLGHFRHSLLGCFGLDDEVALVFGADVVAVHGFLLGFGF
jgi:hypothetical protein